MIFTFESNTLASQLRLLSQWKQLAYGTFIFERALPNFFQFQCETGALGGATLRAAAAKMWGRLENQSTETHEVSIKDCEFVIPDTERYRSLYTPSAVDAATIAANVLQFIVIRNVPQPV